MHPAEQSARPIRDSGLRIRHAIGWFHANVRQSPKRSRAHRRSLCRGRSRRGSRRSSLKNRRVSTISTMNVERPARSGRADGRTMVHGHMRLLRRHVLPICARMTISILTKERAHRPYSPGQTQRRCSSVRSQSCRSPSAVAARHPRRRMTPFNLNVSERSMRVAHRSTAAGEGRRRRDAPSPRQRRQSRRLGRQPLGPRLQINRVRPPELYQQLPK